MYIIISLIPSALLLLGTIDMPYGYYVFLRIFVFLFCGVHSFLVMRFYKYMNTKKHVFSWIYWLTAIIFNPFFEIKFNRNAWIVIDILSAAILIALSIVMYVDKRKSLREFKEYMVSHNMEE